MPDVCSLHIGNNQYGVIVVQFQELSFRRADGVGVSGEPGLSKLTGLFRLGATEGSDDAFIALSTLP